MRQAFFGDLHVHTALSSDAWNYDVRARPRDAYAYAFGREILLPPNDASGRGTRPARIDRPLDFTAVTDHAEFLGETALCADPKSPVYESESCVGIRESQTPLDNPNLIKMFLPSPSRQTDICGEQGEICREAEMGMWEETIAAAQEWNDTSEECERTTFIAFEYSSLRMGSNLHRNVIFKNDRVLSRPVSYMDVQREWGLWKILDQACAQSGTGCDALSIPHNSNISNGRMFAVDYPGTDGLEEERARASLRARMEPLVEIMQHKGDSECRISMPGIGGGPDEACGFEKFENIRHVDDEGRSEEPDLCWDFMADTLPKLGPGACMNHSNYVRYVLTEGLAEEERLGVNPFKLGIMASTDTHNAMAGGVSEKGWPGHLGLADDTPEKRLAEKAGTMAGMAYNPGGLVGVWAEENSRSSIFGALKRREVFGTSGPRIQTRLFGGWDYPDDLCAAQDRLEIADRTGVPMGADLPPATAGDGPVFVALALADPGTAKAPGQDLQRIQIIKGWVEAGELHQRVFDVAGEENGAGVDPKTCESRGQGARELCGVFRDPDFDPATGAVYYARVLENPSCRHSAHECARLAPENRPSGCEHRVMEEIQQERAWTSPIWYAPNAVEVEVSAVDVR
ncbi:MAG: DUF3604 domain-containing protein [Myxococcota bacterium]|nr:DUF3604 domain-containing protein [Myxococcota bacterium]